MGCSLPKWPPKDQKEGQMVMASMGNTKHSNTKEARSNRMWMWVPGEEIKGQEGVLVPREEVQGPFKVFKGNSSAWEKRR